MPGTFSEIMSGAPNVVDFGAPIIDEFEKSSFFLQNLPIKTLAYPSSGRSGWTYQYSRYSGQSDAATRAINADYSNSHATTTPHTVDLAIFGGKFQVDRVFAHSMGLADWMEEQIQQKIKAATAKMNDLIINGDVSVDANGFDGLDAIITANAVNDYNKTSVIDLSSSSNLDTNYKVFLDLFNEAFLACKGDSKAIGVNSKMYSVLMNVAQRQGVYSLSTNLKYDGPSFAGVPIIDLGEKPGATSYIIPQESRTVASTPYTNLTDIYIFDISSAGMHGIAPMPGTGGEQQLMNLYIPTFEYMKNNATVLQTAAVEVVMAIAVERTKAVSRINNIKVA